MFDEYRRLDLCDGLGDKIGGFDTVYVDDETGQPEWLGIRTGLFGMNESFVPAGSVQVRGDRLVTHYTKGEVKDGPNISPTDHLTRADEENLYEYFGRSYAPWSGPDQTVEETVRLRRAPVERDGTVVRFSREVNEGRGPGVPGGDS
jgi:hypothetical protein